MRYHILGSILCGLGIVLLTAWTGYSDAVDLRNIQEDAAVAAGAVTSERIGQTFVVHQSRLHALEVRWIVPDDFQPSAGSRVTLHLRRRPGDDADLATASMPLADLRNNQFVKFVFPALQDSSERAFYFFFDIAPAGSQRGFLSLWASDRDAYPEGQMHVNGLPVDRDLVFRAYYEPDLTMLLGRLKEMLEEYSGGILLALLLLFIPGILLAPFNQMFTAPLALGTGLAAFSAFSILLLFFRIDNPLAPVVIAALLLASAAIRWRSASRTRMPGQLASAWLWLMPAVLSLCLGLLQIRDLRVPLWVDSFTHAQSIQVLLSKGQLPASDFYHFGYHAVTALLAQLAGLPIPQAMLLMGPLLIMLTGLGVFVFSHRLTGSMVAGLASAICIWFLSPTPSYFTTWGRYPLLMGAALLPIALLWVMDWIDQPRFHFPALVWAALTFAGLAFAQVRLTLFYFVFVVIYLLYTLYHAPNHHRVTLLWRLAILFLMALAVGLIWLAFVFSRGLTPQALLAQNVGGPSIDVTTAIAVSLRHHGPELILLSLPAAMVGLLRRSKTTMFSLSWYVTLYLIALLPRSAWGGALISPDLVILMGFVPVALVIGDTISYLHARLGGADCIELRLLWGITGALVILIGARDLVSIVNPATVQFSSVDAQAMEWIREETPREASFLINSFDWYSSAFVPSDGGAWIPFVTGRSTYYIDGPSAMLASNSEQLARWIAARHIGYIYLGMRSGILRQTDLACRPDRYALVYHLDGVEIYQVRAPGATDLPGAAPANCSAQGMQVIPPPHG
jgi:hypothetical protein